MSSARILASNTEESQMSPRKLLTVCATVALVGVTVAADQSATPDLGRRHAGNRYAQDVLRALGIPRPTGSNPIEYSKQVAEIVRARSASHSRGTILPMGAGIARNMESAAPLSAAILTSIAGQNEVTALGDWDGQEDLFADHSGTIDQIDGVLVTRAAVSEHTIANGFTENIYYYGDSVGNLYVTSSSSAAIDGSANDTVVMNLPTILNAFGTLSSDDQIVITGIAVNPVADLTSFSNVNGSFSPFTGQIGEIVYVTFWDAGSGLRLTSTGEVVRSGLLAFPVADVVSGAAAPPIYSDTGFPVTVASSFGVMFSTFANLAGVAVDDDGSIYVQLVDLINFRGGNVVKITDTGSDQDRSAATNGFPTLTTLTPTNGDYGTGSGPASQINHFTNFTGTSMMFGNISAIAAGPRSTLYAAMAASYTPGAIDTTTAFQGPFQVPGGPTPSAIISFADCAGGLDTCHDTGAGGSLPVGDGFADPMVKGATVVPGVNNFRVFARGEGPLGAAPFQKGARVAMQSDYSIYAGLTVDEEGTVYMISGGTPAGVGLNPSPRLGEILVFPDVIVPERVADFVDLRSFIPRIGATTGPGDGVSNRYDHIFWQAPMDETTATPRGVAGLSRGFLMYLNRTRNDPARFLGLPNGTPQGDDVTHAVIFADFDPSEQVAGGDDAFYPNRGDDQSSGFEFNFGGANYVDFYLNSNGSVSFGAGDSDNIPTPDDFATGPARIAPAWGDLDPHGRTVSVASFPLQALGFTSVNTFAARWINVPNFGYEGCGSRNTVTVFLNDDGTGVDESAVTYQEGPTALRYRKGLGTNPRPEGSGRFQFAYGRMDTLGTSGFPFAVGYTVGGLGSAPAETNFALVKRNKMVGTGTQPMIYQFFDAGENAGPGVLARPDFFLRAEGNSPAACKPQRQRVVNRQRLDFAGNGI